MSAYKSFAVAGAGMLGIQVVNALAAKNVTVIVLSRPGSSAKTVPAGVQVVTVNFADSEAIAKALKEHNVDVVISTVTTTASFEEQKPLLDGAKAGGIKLFVPAEFGMPTEGHTQGPLGVKYEVAKYLKTLGIPSTRIYTGAFTQFLGGMVKDGKALIVGKGETPVSVTSVPDIAGYIAHIVTTQPPSVLENVILRIEGERVTMKEVAAQFGATPVYVDKMPGEHGEFLTGLMRIMDMGAGSTGWLHDQKKEGTGNEAAGSGNALWPGHHWQTLKEVHNL
ncbi:NmrA domain-containing protein [Favolaschia claudopus]|uniref:NmrA domain-containing protein n=1 Tax=Favolaschia claudopus TaxID=2862362 RepID=A0AAW0C4I0_9AGAR